MKKIAILLAVLVSTACSAQDNFSGQYQRIKSSEFEQNHNMNTNASIEQKEGLYLVTLHSGYGNVSHSGKIVDGKLIVSNNELMLTKDKNILKMSYVDAPEVIFTFKQN